VEPVGADSMWRSFAAGGPQRLERVATVADSLGAPYALPYSFGLCRRFADEIVRLDDAALIEAMRLAFEALKLALEPAGAAATAALLGPLRDRLAGRHVGVLVCGSNIDLAGFARLLGAPAAVAGP
jgi:threonine dehydratase